MSAGGGRGGALAAAFGASAIWGANYAIAKRALVEIDPLALAGARALAAVAFFAILLGMRDGRRGLAPARLWRALPVGLLGIFANQILFVTGLARTSAAHAAILIAALPIFVLGIALVTGGERPSPRRAAGILLAFAGVLIVVLERGIDFRSEYLRGDLLTLGAVLTFAAYTVSGRPLVRDLGALRATGLAFIGGGALVIVVSAPACARQPWTALSPAALAGLAYVVVFSTLVAYLLYYGALQRIDPSQVAAFSYVQVLVAGIVAFAAGGERFSAAFLAGAALIIAGVATAERG